MPTADRAAGTLFWRPGCGFCTMLERGLTSRGLAPEALERRNIWEDPDAAAELRRHARGHETVPTVVIGERGLVNPSADEVIAELAEQAPEHVPEGWEPPGPSAVGRLLGRVFDR